MNAYGSAQLVHQVPWVLKRLVRDVMDSPSGGRETPAPFEVTVPGGAVTVDREAVDFECDPDPGPGKVDPSDELRAIEHPMLSDGLR